MAVGINDLARLTVELGERNISDAHTWALEAGIEPEALTSAIDAVIVAVRTKLEERVDEETVDEHGVAFVAIDFAQVVGQACANSFVLGWEIRDQYGKPKPS